MIKRVMIALALGLILVTGSAIAQDTPPGATEVTPPEATAAPTAAPEAAPATKAPPPAKPASKVAKPDEEAAKPEAKKPPTGDKAKPDDPKEDTKGETAKPDDPEDVPEAIGTAKAMWSYFKGGKYREGVAALIVLLMFIWRRFFSHILAGKLSKWWLGFFTMLLGFLGTIPEALCLEPFKWSVFIWSGLITSAEAMLFWQMILKQIPWFKIPDNLKKEGSGKVEASESEEKPA